MEEYKEADSYYNKHHTPSQNKLHNGVECITMKEHLKLSTGFNSKLLEQRNELLEDKEAISNEKEMWKGLAKKSTESYFRKVLVQFCHYLVAREDGMYDICEDNKKVVGEFLNEKEVEV